MLFINKSKVKEGCWLHDLSRGTEMQSFCLVLQHAARLRTLKKRWRCAETGLCAGWQPSDAGYPEATKGKKNKIK